MSRCPSLPWSLGHPYAINKAAHLKCTTVENVSYIHNTIADEIITQFMTKP